MPYFGEKHYFGDERYRVDAERYRVGAERFNPHGPNVYLLWNRKEDYPLWVGATPVHNVCARIGRHVGYWQTRGYDPATLFPEVEIIRCQDNAHMLATEQTLQKWYRPPKHRE
jgi:hypothetical protein